ERLGLLEEHGEEELERVGLAAAGAAHDEADASVEHGLGRAARLDLGERAFLDGEEALERGLGGLGARAGREARAELVLHGLFVGGDAGGAEDAVAQDEGFALAALATDERLGEGLARDARAGVA